MVLYNGNVTDRQEPGLAQGADSAASAKVEVLQGRHYIWLFVSRGEGAVRFPQPQQKEDRKP